MLKKPIAFIVLLSLAGCATTLHPEAGFEISMDIIDKFKEKYSVELINDHLIKPLESFSGAFTLTLMK